MFIIITHNTSFTPKIFLQLLNIFNTTKYVYYDDYYLLIITQNTSFTPKIYFQKTQRFIFYVIIKSMIISKRLR